MKIITMIPARISSSRVRKKNIRYLGEIPLISHIIRSAKSSKLAKNITINSESEIFAKIAKNENVNFYMKMMNFILWK